jgi:hypothetical protein
MPQKQILNQAKCLEVGTYNSYHNTKGFPALNACHKAIFRMLRKEHVKKVYIQAVACTDSTINLAKKMKGENYRIVPWQNKKLLYKLHNSSNNDMVHLAYASFIS